MKKLWLAIIVFLVGGAVGAVGVVATTFVNSITSTEAFCTSCHSTAAVAADPYYRQSAHRMNAAGVLASCSDCHVPANNFLVETYSHLIGSVRDSFAEYTGNFSDPAVWRARLPELSRRVRDEMRNEDSVTCRKCHDAVAIRPASAAGQAAHAMLAQGTVTCIDCHADIAHAPVSAPTPPANQ